MLHHSFVFFRKIKMLVTLILYTSPSTRDVHRVDGAEMASPLPSSFPHFPLKQGIVVLAVNKNGHLIYIPHIQWFNYCFLDEKSLFSFSLCNWNWMDGAVQRYIKFHTQASFSFPSTSFISLVFLFFFSLNIMFNRKQIYNIIFLLWNILC